MKVGKGKLFSAAKEDGKFVIINILIEKKRMMMMIMMAIRIY